MSESQTVRRAALNLLARRNHSAFELSRKLQSKTFNQTEIHTALATLQEEGLLNDDCFTENFIHYRRTKGYGPLRIRAELIDRGIAHNLIEHHLKITDNAWLDDARKAWQKRFKNCLPHDMKSRAQQMCFLHYRGFTSDQINQLLQSDD